MSVLHLAVADDDVFRRHVALTTVTVSSALDGDTVITGIEEAVLDEYTVTALWVTAVTIGTVVNHLYPTDGDIGRVQGMNHPEWRTQQRDILQQNTFALIKTDKLRAQTVFRTEYSLGRTFTFLIIHRDSVLTVLQ